MEAIEDLFLQMYMANLHGGLDAFQMMMFDQINFSECSSLTSGCSTTMQEKGGKICVI